MHLLTRLRAMLPELAKVIPRPVRDRIVRKEDAELAFWKSRLEIDGGTFQNSHYERLMLGMAGEPDAGFLAGKVVADFGCGPRGSLVWASPARMRIGMCSRIDTQMNSRATSCRTAWSI
jgi:hypothetical protein